jgi:hypothetical protein
MCSFISLSLPCAVDVCVDLHAVLVGLTAADVELAVKKANKPMEKAVELAVKKANEPMEKAVEGMKATLQGMETGMNHLMSSAMDPWEKTSGSRSHAAAADLTAPVLQFYGFAGDHRLCHLVGKVKHVDKHVGKDPTVITAHIWPNHTNGAGLQLFNLANKDLNSERNFLRLHEQVEKAFDHRQLTFVFYGGKLSAHVLDPALMNQCIAGTQLTFADWHQKALTFRNKERPFHRLLAAHAAKSFAHAETQGWIQPHELSALQIRAQELARHSLDAVARANIERWAISSGRAAGSAGAGTGASSTSSLPAAAPLAASSAAPSASAGSSSSSVSDPSTAPQPAAAASSSSPSQAHVSPSSSAASALPVPAHKQRGRRGQRHRQPQPLQRQQQQQPTGSS